MRRPLRYSLALLVMAAVCTMLVPLASMRTSGVFGAFTDRDFAADYRLDDRQIGVALRLPAAGILGKARYFVIVVRDRQGRLVETLYEGPGGYPDPPQRPAFVSANGARVIYDIPEVGCKTFVVGGETVE